METTPYVESLYPHLVKIPKQYVDYTGPLLVSISSKTIFGSQVPLSTT